MINIHNNKHNTTTTTNNHNSNDNSETNGDKARRPIRDANAVSCKQMS